jgi:hypothetical protein
VIRLRKNYLECLDMVVGWLLVVDTVGWIFLLGMLNVVPFMCLGICVFSIFP